MTDTEVDIGDGYPEPENLYGVLRKLPLFDNPYLGMQAMNIGVTNAYLEQMESDLLAQYMERERTPTMEAITVSAWSQMWIFALYELLRTWRQRAAELIAYGAELEASDPKKKSQIMRANRAKIKRAATHTIDEGSFNRMDYEHVERDSQALLRLRLARDLVGTLYERLDWLRVTLAKHEIPKTGRNPMFAQAPGYGRIDPTTGSICWMVNLKDGESVLLSRRRIADDLRALSLGLDRVAD